MIWAGFQDASVDALSARVVVSIFVEESEVQQGADVRRELPCAALVKFEGLLVMSEPIVLKGQAKEGTAVFWIVLQGSLVQCDDLGEIPSDGGQGRCPLVGVFGMLFDWAKDVVKQLEGFFFASEIPERFGSRKLAPLDGVTSLFGGLVVLQCALELIGLEANSSEIILCQGSAIALLEGTFRLGKPAE